MLDEGPVEGTVYDRRGREVKILASGQFEAGRHEIVWRADDNDGRSMAGDPVMKRLLKAVPRPA